MAIRANVEKLGQHILSYDSFMKKMGASLTTTVSHFNNASHEFKKIDKDVIKIAGGESKIEQIVIEKPKSE
jgi:DNA recombination protein RmuC